MGVTDGFKLVGYNNNNGKNRTTPFYFLNSKRAMFEEDAHGH